jgi:hypothetical protein
MMCFSATASFVAAGVTGAVGIVALSRARRPSEWPLAAVPLIFAAQQGVEGLLWLQLPVAPDAPSTTVLTYLFLLFAEVLWPAFAPMACLLIEPNKRRRLLMAACLVAGLAVASYYLVSIFSNPHAAQIIGHHVSYVNEGEISYLMGTAYLVATGGVIALSSHRAMVALSAIVMVGAFVSYMLYWESFVSVWCFFAATASIVILAQFEWEHRRRLRSETAIGA